MSFRFWVILVAVFAVAGGVLPIAAQSANQSKQYDPERGVLEVIAANGTIMETIQLPLPEGYTRFSPYAAMDDVFSFMTYRVTSSDGARNQFIFYDYRTKQIRIAYNIDEPITDSLDYDPSAYELFSGYGFIAYGYAPTRDTSSTWNLLVFQRATNELEYRLTHEEVPHSLSEHVVPIPYGIDIGQLTFGLRPLSCPCASADETRYRWWMLDGMVREESNAASDANQADSEHIDHDPLWLAAVYDPLAARVWLINNAGQVVYDRRLPAPTSYPDAIVDHAAATGDLVAYILAQRDGAGQFAEYAYHLYLYDIGLDEVIYDQPLPENTIISTLEFDRHDEHVFYLATVRPRVWEVSQMRIEPSANHHEVSVVTTMLTSVDSRLAAYEPNVLAMDYPPTPRILSASGDRVLLTIEAIGEAPSAQVIQWHPLADSVSILDGITVNPQRLGFCNNPNCDDTVLLAVRDPRFAFAFERAYNALQVFLPYTNELNPFLVLEDRSLFRTFFVENGTLVLVEGAVREGDSSHSVWEVFTRAGISDSPRWQPDTPINSVWGTRTGFLYTSDGVLYEQVDARRLGASERIAELPAQDARILGLWEAYTSFTGATAWANLNDGFITFSPGDIAVITEAGNQVRMRLTPGGEVQRQFNAGSQVTIVDGPRDVGGVRWWQVRDENGMYGWIAQDTGGDPFIALQS